VKVGLTVVAVVSADVAGNLFLRQGMRDGWKLNPLVGCGVLCMSVSFFLFATLLSRADLSFVLPMTALGYAVNVLGARCFLKEKVTAVRWAGTLFICAGVALVSLSQGLR